jgi:hypothetical protein
MLGFYPDDSQSVFAQIVSRDGKGIDVISHSLSRGPQKSLDWTDVSPWPSCTSHQRSSWGDRSCHLSQLENQTDTRYILHSCDKEILAALGLESWRIPANISSRGTSPNAPSGAPVFLSRTKVKLSPTIHALIVPMLRWLCQCRHPALEAAHMTHLDGRLLLLSLFSVLVLHFGSGPCVNTVVVDLHARTSFLAKPKS